MKPRLEMLEKLTAGEEAEPFAWYGLAMEYRKLGRLEDALGAFTKLRERAPSYLPAFLMAAQVLIALERGGEAREWLEVGSALATQKGDAKTLSELRDALEDC